MQKELENQKIKVFTRTRDYSLYSVFHFLSVLLHVLDGLCRRDSFLREDVNEPLHLIYDRVY